MEKDAQRADDARVLPVFLGVIVSEQLGSVSPGAQTESSRFQVRCFGSNQAPRVLFYRRSNWMVGSGMPGNRAV